MKVNAYLIIEVDVDYLGLPRTGTMRVVKNKPGLLLREIAFELAIDIPDVFYKRVVPLVDISLPTDMLVNPDPDIVVSITAGKVAEALRLDVKTVEDGLAAMLKEQTEKQEENHGI